MKEIRDREQLTYYLHAHQIESIFNEQLLPHLSLYSFDQGEFICSQGDAPQYLYVLVKGKIKIYITSEEGKTLILSFKTPLELIGDIEYVQEIPIINTVEAISPVLMIGVHHKWLKKYGTDYAPLLQFLLEVITKKFHMKSNYMCMQMMHPVEVRLASYLLSISSDESESPLKERIGSDSLVDIANLIGTSYRHLNRIIHRFSTQGLIERGKGFIFIKNREGLRMAASRNIYEKQMEE